MAENSHLQQITARFSMKARKHVAFLFGSHNAREPDCRVWNYPFNYIGTVLKLPGATWMLRCRSAPRCHFLVWSLKKIKEFKNKRPHLPTCTPAHLHTHLPNTKAMERISVSKPVFVSWSTAAGRPLQASASLPATRGHHHIGSGLSIQQCQQDLLLGYLFWCNNREMMSRIFYSQEGRKRNTAGWNF